MNERELRQAVLDTALAMNRAGINRGKSGNVAARYGGGFLVTPSAMDYASMTPDDVVFVRMDGTFDGARKPSTEWQMHRDIFAARPEIDAVLHAHPPFATALACLRKGVPAFHYMVAMAGGADIRCSSYATFGTPELSAAAVQALDERLACLLANHGLLALGASLTKALALAVEVETLCEQYIRALQVGEPVLLDAVEMARVLRKFESYGR